MRIIYAALVIALFSTQNLSGQAIEGTLLGTWSDSTLVGSARFNNTYNEIWGTVANGVEYAILGTTLGTHFIDVSDPSQPNNIITINGGSTGPAIIHRDYHDLNGYLYAVSDEGGLSTLQIMDLSFLPDSVPVVYDSREFIRRSHNIFIDTSSAIMYSCISDGTDVSFAPLRLFDVSNPFQPEVIADYSSISNFNFSQVHDAYVQNDTAYLNCGPHGFLIADFADPLAPKGLTILTPDDYEQSGYNHSGWLSEDGQTYFMADEDWDMDIKVLDVTSLPDLTVIDTIDAGSENIYSIPHNQIVLGDYLYSSYYYDGLQVWNISDVNNIERVLYFPTSNIEPRENFEGAWGVYPFLPSGLILVSDMQEGLFVIEGVENTLSTTTNIDKLQSEWQISPNPSSGQFVIDYNSDLKNVQLELFSTDGQKIQNLKRDNQLELADGIYMVRLTSGQNQSSKKIFISN